jgi:small subunit ribosomal protein S4e
MVKNHIKRMNAPKKWDVLRKETTFVSRPNPGRDMNLCLSLNTAMKDMLGKSQNTKESKYIIRYRGVLVNGTRRYDEKFPVGFMDVITFPEIKESYRLLVNQKNKLFLQKINDAEAGIKVSKISDKKQVARGMVQVNCSDGRNFLFKADEPVARELKLNDSIVYTLPEQKFKELIKLEKGALVYLYKGKHIGRIVKAIDFKGSDIIFKLDEITFETKRAYAFVIGKETPVISLPEWKKGPDKKNKEPKEHSKEAKESKDNKEKKTDRAEKSEKAHHA